MSPSPPAAATSACPIAALFLHLLLPEDRVLDEEKEHYPRAFSDDEIAYET